MKNRGFNRVSPTNSPIRKQTQNQKFNCQVCRLQFESKTSLDRHSHNSNEISDPSQRVSDLQETAMGKKIQIIKSKDRRQYNCHQCDFQGISSKNLYNHVRNTSHLSDPLEEKCYTCDRLCLNWEELMQHRKIAHAKLVNQCKYYRDSRCKFKTDCWFSHESQLSQRSETSNNSSNFQMPQNIPPDQSIRAQMEQITMMMTKIMTKFGGEDSQNIQRKRHQGV